LEGSQVAFIWLVWWLASSAPTVELLVSWNPWGVAFVACLGIDVVSALTWTRRGRHWRYVHAFGRTYVAGRGWARGEPDVVLRQPLEQAAERGGRAIGDAPWGQPEADERV
jgi:hypothetical protein